ncbi:MAG TPA: hypothetical protein VKC60_12875 [Opitutaceae bacterium]|nr:hypothetical protein [Opitutaceae bacterium]
MAKESLQCVVPATRVIKTKMRFIKHLTSVRPNVFRMVGFGSGLLLCGAAGALAESFVSHAHAQQETAPKPKDVGEAQVDMETLRELLPDLAHVMTDVGYHFTNLWFAADKQNWPLANYYLGLTRSHLKWAVRIRPTRKNRDGTEVDLRGILDAVDKSSLTEVADAIAHKDTVKFKAAYRQTLGGCYACHTACEKPFLRPQVPNAPSASILNFDPNPTGPE